MARVPLSPAECSVPGHCASAPPPPVASRRDVPGKTPHVRNDTRRVWPAAASTLSRPDPDAPTAAPEDLGGPADLALCGSAAAAGARHCGRPALDRPLQPGPTESTRRPSGQPATLSDAARPPAVSPAMDYGGAS